MSSEIDDKASDPRFRILAINFHYVRPQDHRYPGLHRRSPIDFSSQLDALMGLGELISPKRLENILLHPDDRHPERGFVLTFDDGLKDHIQHVAPELNRRQWQAFFFVNTASWQGEMLDVHRLQLLNASVPFPKLYGAFIKWLRETDQSLDPSQIPLETVRQAYAYDEDRVALFKYCINFEMSPQTREELLRELSSQFLGDDTDHLPEFYLSKGDCRMLADMGHTIGSHSHRHRPLSLLSPEDCATDLAENAQSIDEAIGRRPTWISFPNGVLDADDTHTLAACQQQGIRYGFTMNQGFIQPGANHMTLNRVDTNDAPGGKSPTINW